MSQSTHRFVLEMDAEQAKRAAKEFRQMMESELGNIGGSGSAPLASTQKAVEQIAKTDMFTDAAKRAEQLENTMRRIRDLSSQIQNMDVRHETNSPRWVAQVEEFYKKVEQSMGKQQADLARGRNVIPSVGAVGAEFAKDTVPVEEWSVQALRTPEEVRKMSNEYNKIFAELSQAQAERIRLEREGIEEEIRAIESYISSNDDDGSMLQRLYDLAKTKERMVKEEAQELAAYQRAMQEYIANDRPAMQSEGATTSTRFTISKDSVKNMDKLVVLLQQAEGLQKSIGDSLAQQAAVNNSELAERRKNIEAEYQGRIKILEAERKSFETSSRLTMESDQQAANQKILQAEARTALEIAKQGVKVEERKTAELEQQTQELKRQTAVANRDVAQTNLANQQERTRGQQAATETAAWNAMRAEQQAIKQSLRNALEGEEQKTAIAKAEAAERVEAARRESTELRAEKAKEVALYREEEARKTAIVKEEARRQTAAVVQELRERNRQQTQMRNAASGFLRNTAQDLVLGGLGLYGADQVVSQSYNFAKTGAQQLRTMETFANLAKNVGADADDMLDAIQRASSGTISEFDAMSYASQLFAQKFAGDVTNIESDMEIVIKGARRFSQIYTDEFGALLGVQEIFSRLLKYVREGNKELVDQFGISNQAIANALNIPNEGLGGAEGTLNRWKGLLLLIEEQMGRLGEATNSTADRFEQSEARISDAVNRLRQSSAEPIAFVVEVAADLTEQAVGDTLAGDYATSVARQIKELDKLKDQLKSLSPGELFRESPDLGNQLLDVTKFREKITEISLFAKEALYFEVQTDTKSIEDAREEMSQFNEIASLVTDEFSRASVLAQAGVLSPSAYNTAKSELVEILASLQAGNIEYETAKTMIDNINVGLLDTSSVFAFVIPQAWDFAAAMTAAATANANTAGNIGNAMAQRQQQALANNPSLAALNASGALGTSFNTTVGNVSANSQFNLAAGFRQARRTLEEQRAYRTAQQNWSDYSFSRLSSSDQLSTLETRRAGLVASGAPQSEIKNLDLSIQQLRDSIMDQVIATNEQVNAIYEQDAFDAMTPQQQLAYLNEQLSKDQYGDLERAQMTRDRNVLQRQVDEQTAQENATKLLSDTESAINSVATIDRRLQIAQESLGKAIGTPAEEGARQLLMGVLDQQEQVSQIQWQSAYDVADTLTKMEMKMTQIEGEIDPVQRQQFAREYADLQGQYADEQKRAAESAQKEQAQLDEKRRQADMAALDDSGQLAYLKDYIATLQEGTEEYEEAREDINRLERRLAEEATRENTAAFEKAAKDMAKAFEEELGKALNIPGVLSPSTVTEQDMIDSKYGLYRENADEWLRQAKDELINGVNRENVDAGSIASMLGLEGGLPNEVLYGRLESAWADQSLFADPANLGLLNTDAIMSRYMDIKKGEIGRQNLEDYIAKTLQISIGDASAIAGTQSPIVQQLTGGQSGAEIASQIASIQSDVMSNLDSGFVSKIANGWQKDIDENIAKLDPLADALADRINSRLTDKLGNITGLVDSVAAKVLEIMSSEDE